MYLWFGWLAVVYYYHERFFIRASLSCDVKNSPGYGIMQASGGLFWEGGANVVRDLREGIDRTRTEHGLGFGGRYN